MSDSLKQSQTAGDHSTNLQAQRIEIHQHQGLTLAEAREEFMTLFEANFCRLQSVARETAQQRATNITEKFLAELSRRNPSGLQACQDPDMQAAVFSAQREYARSGRKELEKVLIDLLVERTTAANLKCIVLNEAIAVSAKLTSAQLDTLSFVLLFAYNAPLRYTFHNLEDFGEYLRQYIAPLLSPTIADASTFLHLKYTGCASTESGGRSIIELIRDVFPACFTEGFRGPEQDPPVSILRDYVIPAFHTESAFQFLPMDDRTFRALCLRRHLSEEAIAFLENLQVMHGLDVVQISDRLRQIDERFALISEPSYTTAMALGNVQLTTVGIALANVNLRHRVGLDFDLGEWIA
jgi:hypothetical protein